MQCKSCKICMVYTEKTQLHKMKFVSLTQHKTPIMVTQIPMKLINLIPRSMWIYMQHILPSTIVLYYLCITLKPPLLHYFSLCTNMTCICNISV